MNQLNSQPVTDTDQTSGAPTQDALPPPPSPEKTSVLERLGSSPFPRGKFPFLGILASIYEHVSEVTQRRYPRHP